MPTTSISHSDLRELFLKPFSGHKDEFGKETPLPKSLAFDRVNENKPFSSDFFLSRFPIEVVWNIIELVPKEDLGNLAMVNRDCRQLARSRQFSNVVLDYSKSASGLVNVLLNEKLERSLNNGITRLPSIGACIRRITIATESNYVAARHMVSLSKEFHEIDKNHRNLLLDQACASFANYMQSIILILSTPAVLPLLESLNWMDRALFDEISFKALTNSKIQNLSLNRIHVDNRFILTRTIKECNWNLKTLYLDISWKFGSLEENTDLSPLVASFLYLVSPTLETLRWRWLPSLNSLNDDDSTAEFGDGSELPSFPKLQNLEMNALTSYDSTWLQPLLQSRNPSSIRNLSIDIGKNKKIAEFFLNCGQLPHLKTFVWSGTDEEYIEENMSFLAANPQIHGFNRDWPMTPYLISNRLLPLLCDSFNKLTSLSLTWKGEQEIPETATDSIPQEALNQIANLHNLEQLYLSAGCQIGWRHSWVVDHSALQNMCHDLPRLRKLALGRDTYHQRQASSNEAEDYFNSILGLNDPIRYYEHTYRAGDLIPFWERGHRNRMVTYANQYAEILPKLEWIFLGQLPMDIKRVEKGKGEAVLLSDSRDSCYTLLKRIFGM